MTSSEITDKARDIVNSTAIHAKDHAKGINSIEGVNNIDSKNNTEAKNNSSLWCESYHEEISAYLHKHFRFDAACMSDIIQNTYIRFSQVETKISQPRTYAFRIAHNLALDSLRKAKSDQDKNEQLQHVQANENSICPEREIANKQILEIVNTTIWSLPERRRKIFVMHKLEGLSFAEIGRRIDISEAAVRKHVSKALALCLETLKSHGLEQ